MRSEDCRIAARTRVRSWSWVINVVRGAPVAAAVVIDPVERRTGCRISGLARVSGTLARSGLFVGVEPDDEEPCCIVENSDCAADRLPDDESPPSSRNCCWLVCWFPVIALNQFCACGDCGDGHERLLAGLVPPACVRKQGSTYAASQLCRKWWAWRKAGK